MKLNRKITFYKTREYKDNLTYVTVSDGFIISTMKEICNEYNAQLKSIELKNSFFNHSCIIIKTDKTTFNKVCIRFCEKLNGYIEDIKF